MRNLVFLGEKRRCASIGSITHPPSSVCDLCRVPSDHGTDTRTVLLTSDGVLVQVNEFNELLWTCNLSECCDEDSGEWFDVTSVNAEQVVCLSRGGAIVTVSPETGVAEVVGEFENGLEAGQWSPDGEVLLLVTLVDNEDGGKNTVLLSMNAEWEVLAETTVETHVPCSTGEDSGVTVCWRPDATLCAVSTVDAADATRIIRTYKRESLELNSIGRSEDGSGKGVPNLLSQIAWASGGCSNLLTSVQRKGKRTQQVVFFEPNGLRHREFPLRPEQQDSPHATVLGLQWNIESDLLAVSLRELTHDKVQLWHRSNYHWYLKQELRYTSRQISCVKFDEEQSYILYVGLSGEDIHWREYEFQWDASTIHTSMDPSPMCTAASIDGRILNLTPLDKALVPPPMYAASLEMDHPIREVAFTRQSTNAIRAIAYLSDGSFVILGDSLDNKSQLIANYSAPSVIGKASYLTSNDIDITSLRQLLVVGANDNVIDLVAIACGAANEQRDRLVEIRICLEGSGAASVSIEKVITLEGCVLCMVHWLDKEEGALLQLDDGSLLEYSRGESGESQALPSDAEPLLEPCPWISAIYDAYICDEGEGSHRQRLVVGLSARLRLYCHDRLLADAASSFILSRPHQFLCFATADARSVLKSLPLKQLHNFDPLMGSDENYLLEGYEPRNVERGTRLVAILPEKPMAILQMPRGNMEGIYPRALVLPYVMTKIDSGEYGEAFGMMRRQKVDLNLLVDLNPCRFLESGGVNSFLEQVIPVDYLNLFISCLQDFNITQVRYRIPEWHDRQNDAPEELSREDFDFTTKVNQVCLKLRSIMLQAECDGHTVGGRTISDGHFLLPVLSTFAKESPPKLEEALNLIKESAFAVHPFSSRKPPLFGEKAQSSIQYLAFLADYEMLFKTALGMYDYELARAVARNSQMDPKVYLPLLKRLKSCPEYYGRYEVDVRLGRYEAALSNLVKSATNSEDLSDVPAASDDPAQAVGNDFEHCMILVESHALHRLALELFCSNPSHQRRIMLSLGNNLLERKQDKTALAVFLAAEPPLLDEAHQAARKCGDWKFLFTLPSADAVESNESSEMRSRRLAHEIAKEIAAKHAGTPSGRSALADAARILLEYGQDIVGAVEMLISAEMWSEARRIAALHSRQDLVKKSVDAATFYAEACLEDFEERTDTFNSTNKRYMEVLKLRKTAIRESGVAPGEEHDAQVDDSGSLFSMASNASLQSNMSGSSVGSVSSSVSSVITVGAQSTFSITSEHDGYKHKSKYNAMGKEKKKRKKKRSRNRRMRPGSEEELRSLVNTLKVSCVDSTYCEVIAETILFLGQVGRLDLGRELFDGYNAMKSRVALTQQERMDLARNEKEEHERKARREGVDEPFLVLDAEREVDGFLCAELPDTLHDLFYYLQG